MKLDLLTPQRLINEHLQRNDRALVYAAMGISKTAAVLHRLCELLLSGESVAALLVAPIRVGSLTWPMECKKWSCFNWLKVVSLRTEHGQRAFLQGTAHLYICNYESLHHLVSLVERRKGVPPYDVEIWDEITKAKNPGSKRINFFRRKMEGKRAPRRIGMSGTPMPNSEMDLFAQVRLIDDGERLGTSSTNFKKEYFYAPEYQFATWKPKAETHQRIEKKISDLTITLKASDWLNIPDTVVEDIEIEFPPALRKQYETLEKELVIELRKDKTMNVANSAALITKLLQFTSGHMYDENREVHPIHNLKFDALKKLTKNGPILLAYIYQHEEQRIREQFPQARFFSDAKCSSAEKTIAAERRLIEDWSAGKVPILAAHPASASHGLNLQHGASTIVWISITYNREHYEQMIARIARRGQTEVTKVYRLMVNNTVDWAVAEALAEKSQNEARLISALQLLESYRNGGNGR